MDTAKTLYILRCLADGIDPQTGKTYDSAHPFQQPDTVRALFAAVQVLEQGAASPEPGEVKLTFRSSPPPGANLPPSTSLPPNAGKPWDDAEDERLSRSLAGEVSVPQIAAEHGRTAADIRSHLENLGQGEKWDQVTAISDSIPQPEPSLSEPVALDPPRPHPAAAASEAPAGLYVFRKMAIPH